LPGRADRQAGPARGGSRASRATQLMSSATSEASPSRPMSSAARALRAIATAPIIAYQRLVSPAIPRRCQYEPTCCRYVVESIMLLLPDNTVGGSWGLAIIGLTVVIRAALVPLTFRQLKSMQEMQRLAPQINALKQKYKDDKQRQQQEIMKFYQANKINPL